MSEQPPEGFGTASGAGADTGEPSAESAPASPQIAPAEVAVPGPDKAGGVTAEHPAPKEGGGKSLGSDAPTLQDLQGQLCPNCSVGVLYVTRYDPDALHERGQDIPSGMSPPSLPRGFESGGAYDVRCFNCEWSQSYAMNPGQYHGEGR